MGSCTQKKLHFRRQNHNLCMNLWLLLHLEGAHGTSSSALAGSGHLLEKEARSLTGINQDGGINYNRGRLTPAEFLAYYFSRGKKKNYSGEKTSLIVHF